MTTPPSKPFGRSLSDFKELLPAEKLLRDAVRLGEPAVIGTERPSECTPENEIRAGFLRFLALGGDEYAPVHEQGVCVVGAWISGNLDLTACTIQGYLIVGKSCFNKRPTLIDTHFHGSLSLNGSQLPGLIADRLITEGGVFLRDNFSSIGEVRLIGAQIGGGLECCQGNFNNPSGYALSAEEANIKGGVTLSNGFQAKGEVRLLAAHITSNLNCEGGSFNNPNGDALSADGCNIQGDVSLSSDFQAQGEVRLIGAQIGGDLMCRAGSFNQPNGDALLADGASIKGNIYLDNGFQASGAVRLVGTQAGRDLCCDGGSFSREKGDAFVAERMFIAGSFMFHSLGKPVTGINLAGAEVGALVDDEKSWGNELVLDGFVYHRLSGKAPCDASTRIAWLKKQRTDHCNNPNGFKPQPWQQLIATLRAMGHKTAANQIAIERESHLRKIGKVGETPPEWGAWKTTLYRVVSLPLHRLFGTLMAYGYRPIKLAAWMILVWLVSGGLFWWAALSGVFAPSNPLVFDHPKYQHCSPTDAPASPTKENPTLVHCFTEMQSNSLQALTCRCSKSLSCLAESSPPKEKFGNWYLCPELASEYTGFSPLAYSLDLILPLVDLQQEHDWAPYIPTPKATWHEELRQFLHPTDWKYHWTRVLVWFEILFGWVASLLLVAVVSGLTNRDKDD